MKVDPRNPEAEAAATGAGASFRPRAEEARRLAEEARSAAEARGAARAPAFADGVALQRLGEQVAEDGTGRGGRPAIPRGPGPLRAGPWRALGPAPPKPHKGGDRTSPPACYDSPSLSVGLRRGLVPGHGASRRVGR